MAAESAAFIKKLTALIKSPTFTGVHSSMYCSLIFLKDYAKACLSQQFLVMKKCKGGWELQEGAFGPPPPGVKAEYFGYPDPRKQLVVLLHEGIMWDLLVPVRGHEDEFW